MKLSKMEALVILPLALIGLITCIKLGIDGLIWLDTKNDSYYINRH